jgi:DNA-binding Xre family transcriptional regulator
LIKLDKLNRMLGDQKISRNTMRIQTGMGGQSFTNITKILNGERSTDTLSLRTIDRLCYFLNCQPGDILEYVPDE